MAYSAQTLIEHGYIAPQMTGTRMPTCSVNRVSRRLMNRQGTDEGSWAGLERNRGVRTADAPIVVHTVRRPVTGAESGSFRISR